MGEISPDTMEKAECETGADHVAAGRAALGTRELRIGGGAALALPGESSALWSRVVGLGFDEPVTIELIECAIDFYREQKIVSAIVKTVYSDPIPKAVDAPSSAVSRPVV